MKKLTKGMRLIIIIASALILGSAAFGVTFSVMQEDEFYIYNLGIDITNENLVVFYPFGDGFQHAGSKVLPTFEYNFDGSYPEIEVYAPCGGVIGLIEWQEETKDYEMQILPRNNRTYKVLLDHVNDLTVKEGDKVTAGQVLGKIGNEVGPTEFYPDGIAWYCRTELMIKNLRDNVDVAPFSVFDPKTKATYETQIMNFMQDRDLGGDYFLYDKMVMPGCYFTTLPGEDEKRPIKPVEVLAGLGVGIGVGIISGLIVWIVLKKYSLKQEK